MKIRTCELALSFLIWLGGTSLAVTPNHIDDFASPGTNGWTSANANTNPETGGVDGPGDGYLNIAQLFSPFNFGSHNNGPDYTGDWKAAGITEVSFYLNDVNTDEEFSFHFLVSNPETTWQFNTGFDPPTGSWQQYTVDLTDDANWTRIRGSASFSDVLGEVSNAHFRHDLAPFDFFPDAIMGDIGIDNITLVPEPATLGFTLMGFLILAGKRSRRSSHT